MADRHPLDPHLTSLRRDLDVLADDLRWAHADAWWPIGGGLDKPKGRSLAKPMIAEDPDQVDGPRYDLGTGVHGSREALHAAVEQLQVLELRLAAAVIALGARARQPALLKPTAAHGPTVLSAAVKACSWRLDRLEAVGLDVERRAVAAARPHLRAAARAADVAARGLHHALTRGDRHGEVRAEPNCRICGIRPMAVRAGTGRPSKGGRCDTCGQYFTRKGQERPTSLDQDAVTEARQAAERRRARGEGWGAA